MFTVISGAKGMIMFMAPLTVKEALKEWETRNKEFMQEDEKIGYSMWQILNSFYVPL